MRTQHAHPARPFHVSMGCGKPFIIETTHRNEASWKCDSKARPKSAQQSSVCSKSCLFCGMIYKYAVDERKTTSQRGLSKTHKIHQIIAPWCIDANVQGLCVFVEWKGW